jgi:hypothetical protein
MKRKVLLSIPICGNVVRAVAQFFFISIYFALSGDEFYIKHTAGDGAPHMRIFICRMPTLSLVQLSRNLSSLTFDDGNKFSFETTQYCRQCRKY